MWRVEVICLDTTWRKVSAYLHHLCAHLLQQLQLLRTNQCIIAIKFICIHLYKTSIAAIDPHSWFRSLGTNRNTLTRCGAASPSLFTFTAFVFAFLFPPIKNAFFKPIFLNTFCACVLIWTKLRDLIRGCIFFQSFPYNIIPSRNKRCSSGVHRLNKPFITVLDKVYTLLPFKWLLRTTYPVVSSACGFSRYFFSFLLFGIKPSPNSSAKGGKGSSSSTYSVMIVIYRKPG